MVCVTFAGAFNISKEKKKKCMNLQRLDKIISSQLNISRSVARADIRRGKVTVNKNTIRDPAAQADPQNAEITYLGQPVFYKEFIYIIMNKPKGVISASTDKSRETVVDLVPQHLKRNSLFPVGRLDKDTTGLLLITDDGDFAHRVVSPKKSILKTYIANLDGAVTVEMTEIFANGVVLADGTVCRPAFLRALEGTLAEIKIPEGRYHQIKRMFGTVGLGVNGLERIALGNLTLPEDIGYGECRELSENEINAIFVN